MAVLNKIDAVRIQHFVAHIDQLSGGAARLTGLEIPGEDYEAMLEEHHAMLRHQFKPSKESTGHMIFEVCGVALTKKPIPISDAVLKRGAEILASHRGMDNDELARRIYCAMREADILEKRGENHDA